MKSLRTVCIAFSCFLLLACGSNMPVYDGQGVTIRYPNGWTTSTEDKSVLLTISHANRSLKTVDGTLTVAGQPMTDNNFSALQKANEETLKNTSVNQGFQAEKVKINNQDTFLWKYERIGADNKKTYFRQAMVAAKGIVYTITAIGETTVPVGDLEESVKSFTVPNS